MFESRKVMKKWIMVEYTFFLYYLQILRLWKELGKYLKANELISTKLSAIYHSLKLLKDGH